MADAAEKQKKIFEEDVHQAENIALRPSDAEDGMALQPLIALCLSGGGVRSATFCLGVLQALAAHRPQGGAQGESSLERIHYLSTVSGGGYIGGWLTALIARNRFDYGKVARALAEPPPAPPHDSVLEQDTAVEGDRAPPDPIGWLRNHSSYLAPRRGWSPDTWANVALYLRHLAINWIALVPLVLSILLLPLVHLSAVQAISSTRFSPHLVELLLFGVLTLRHVVIGGTAVKLSLDAGTAAAAFALAVLFFDDTFGSMWGSSAGESPETFGLVLAMGFIPFVLVLEWTVGTVVSALSRPAKGDALRERLSRGGGRALAVALAWAALHALVFFLPSWILELGANTVIGLVTAGGAAGVATALGGYWSRLPERQRNRLRDKLARAALQIAAVVFIVFFLGGFGALLNMRIILAVVGSTASNRPPAAAVQNYSDTKEAVLGRLSKFPAPPNDTRKAPKEWKERLEEEVSAQLDQEAKGRLRSAAKEVLEGTDTTIGRTLMRLEERLAGYARTYKKVLRPLPAPGLPLALFILFVMIATGAMAYLGVNTFSLTTFYGNRLIRAYLGASRPVKARKPDPYTGFDPDDDLPLALAARADGKPTRLFHVMTAALNLSRGSQLRWQQRKASSFTMSPLHTGSWTLGYQRTAAYGDEHGLTVGAAMAVSGAAVSPNMGYHTSPLVTFVLTFFNARLGSWLPNPGIAGCGAWKASEPGLRDLALIKELTARASDDKRFVYVSDGGHFDNLGLYEMVRRRCTRIIAVDAGADADFRYDDLASVLAKVRVDLGVEIDFPRGIEPQKQPEFLFHVATIRYPNPAGEPIEGHLVYLKPVIDDLVPIDVRRYAKNHNEGSDRFPHQSTANQFFNEEQFESYRMLGLHLMNRVLEAIGSLENRPTNARQVRLVRTNAVAAEAAGTANAAAPAAAPVMRTATTPLVAGSGFGAPLSGALQSLGTAGALSIGLAAGSVVGVAGTVALAPEQKVQLEQTEALKIDPVQFGELKNSLIGLKVTVDKDELDKIDAIRKIFQPLKITIDADELKKLDSIKQFTSNVTLQVNKAPIDEIQKTPIKLPIAIDDKSLASLKEKLSVGVTGDKQLLDLLQKGQVSLRVDDQEVEKLKAAVAAGVSKAVNLKPLQDQLQRIETNTRDAGPRRSLIEGREGGR